MKRCLIVDNKAMMRKIAKIQAEVMGFKVSEAEGAMDALTLCRKKMPDVILLDWMMPDMDGIEFIKELQQFIKRKVPFIIMCSAKESPEDVEAALSAGAHAYLAKPVSLQKLKEVLKDAKLVDDGE